MRRLPVVHLIAKSNTVANATWFSRYGGDLYHWAGTLVYDGKVYDHIHYRARGGVWRYAMVKNMWKFDFNRGHDFQMRDDYGRKLDTKWTQAQSRRLHPAGRLLASRRAGHVRIRRHRLCSTSRAWKPSRLRSCTSASLTTPPKPARTSTRVISGDFTSASNRRTDGSSTNTVCPTATSTRWKAARAN